MADLMPKTETERPVAVNNGNNGVVKNKKKNKEVAPFGNCRNYYGYRVGHDVEEDPRFKVLKKEWFQGKDCLDIGCNSGLITINIAKKFDCRTILGIDIDNNRIKDAWWRLRKMVREEKTGNGCVGSSKTRVKGVNESECAETCSTSTKDDETDTLSVDRNLLDIVSFRCENFVLSWVSLPLENNDTILCLSVTKWVHLNWGDEGLISLFAKFWRLLHPGGILVLEPQPWESYYKNRLTTEITQMNYNNIVYKPDFFQEMLLDKIGFRTVEQATMSVSGATLGFDRAVLVFRK
ncbi:probable RNA methyltransferase At5g51130 [Chenopodium quinoa]|uniref:probable RNA methyltransferase At5g51130 n=1 Tax=Chenopodium quinoa TaxID=63459 RepID=UPI000B7924F3|nr:probable RNA methyltransferase At5g51130 [Chenopodium quinoa]XP_021733879.1 probable RNA methyltransferase At5g51130 [Chenopodium quinoa]XP_021733880.1 probable RNA methyltransferase At5g51130 [Chenopodium quinoa]XP_021733881.1 probable RNA methyltransferase At5g51130 [Chenopodium quinoa]XP_021733882.1 probable RNA methyltransferase At5g51130 [Chenopodium quinoa]